MAHNIKFFVQPRLGEFEINFREMDGIAVIGGPRTTAVSFPTLEIMRKELLAAGMPDSLATLGDHAAIDVSRDQLRSLGFNLE